jgi:hypothetical protein
MIRAFLTNPDKYPDPDNFRPERWLKPGWPTYQEPLTQYPTIKGMTSFGWGQRQCLGQTLTQDELIVACGALAWGFNLKPKKDPVTGAELPVPLDKSNSLLIIKPDPFQMAFEPRSEARREEALRIWAGAESRDRAKRAAFMHGVQCPSLAKGGNRAPDSAPKPDVKREGSSVSLDKLEQLTRDLLLHLKGVPELRPDPAIIQP